MTTDTVTPFIPGARVAVERGTWSNIPDYIEGIVEKVHKNGNFVLRGSKQQWSPWKEGFGDIRRWRARATGEGYRKPQLVLWDSETDKEIQEWIAKAKRDKRYHAIRDQICRMSSDQFTEIMLDQIEKALPKKVPE